MAELLRRSIGAACFRLYLVWPYCWQDTPIGFWLLALAGEHAFGVRS